MSELVSMLVPLHTLPGWPVAPAVTPLDAIGLLIILPLVVIVIISTIGQVGHRVSLSRGRPNFDEHGVGGGTAPGGLGAGTASAALPAHGRPSAADEVGQATGVSAGERQQQQAETDPAGGASARW